MVDVQAAYENLCRALTEYYAAKDAGSYVETWVLLSHVRSLDWESAGTSAVCILSSPDSTWLTRRAIMDVALQREHDRLRQ